MNNTITKELTDTATSLTLNNLLYTTIKQQSKLLQTISNEEWQEYFQQLKNDNIPSIDKNLKNHSSIPCVINRKWALTNLDNIKTTYEYHIDVIKDILKVIRGKSKNKDKISSIDTIYSVGNIKELLRYEPDMQSRLVNDDGFAYIEVWLER